MSAVTVYVVYTAISIALTIFLAQTLFRNGAVFLEDVFQDKRMAESINRLLVVGFYLVNFGFALQMMRVHHVAGAQDVFEALAEKLGTLMLTLAAMHFANLYVFHRIRRRRKMNDIPAAPKVLVAPSRSAAEPAAQGVPSMQGA